MKTRKKSRILAIIFSLFLFLAQFQPLVAAAQVVQDPSYPQELVLPEVAPAEQPDSVPDAVSTDTNPVAIDPAGPEEPSTSSQFSTLSSPGNTPPEPTSSLFTPREPAKFTVGNGGQGDVIESTGAFAYSYPLDIPKGRNGLQPNLTLSYNSQNSAGSSLFGFGWDGSIPFVTRTAKKGIDMLYATNTFALSLGGTGDLVPMAVDPNGFGTYAAVTEENFYKIEYLSSLQWKVTDKVGTVYTFGASAQSRQDDPANASHIYRWMLQDVRDTNDNFVRYEYFKNSGQIYPSKIFYTGNGVTDGVFQVNFEPFATGTPTDRPDIQTSFEAGFSVTTRYLVQRINILVQGSVKKFYEFSFSNGDNIKRSLLTGTTAGAVGAGGVESRMPAVTLTYDHSVKTFTQDPNYAAPFVFEQYDSGDYTLGNETRKFQVLDVNGDGLQDIMKSYIDCSNPSASVNQTYLNNGSTGWDPVPTWQSPVSFFTKTCSWPYVERYKSFQIMDVNGDQFPDFVESFIGGETPVQHVYLNNRINGWDQDATWVVPPIYFLNLYYNTTYSTVNKDWSSKFKTGDVNGDGLTDFIVSYEWYSESYGMVKEVYINNGVNGWDLKTNWNIPITFSKYEYATNNIFTNNYSDSRIIDANGDNLDDIILSRYDQYYNLIENNVYLNNGKDGWYLDPKWHAPFFFTYLTTSRVYNDFSMRFREIDINGDGLLDFVYSWYWDGPPRDDRREVYLNNGKNGWDLSSGWMIPFYFAHTTAQSMAYDYNPRSRIFDAKGDGTVSYVYSYRQNDIQLTTNAVYSNQAINTTDRLTDIAVNGASAIHLAYDQSARMKDGTGAPLNPKLPLNILAVKQISYNDGIGTIATTDYTYSDGSFYRDATDTTKNRFAGFGKVTKARGTTRTITYFHQGGGFSGASLGEYQDNFNKIGKSFRSEAYNASNGTLLNQEITKWEDHDQGSGSTFVFASRATATNHVGSQKSRAINYTYDFTNGNRLTEDDRGEVVANTGTGDITSEVTGDERLTSKDYAQNQAKYILEAQKSGTVTSGSQTRLAKLYYDNLPYGQVDKVNTTKEEYSQNPIQVQRSFNGYGLAISATDPRQKVMTITYDTVNVYPATTTNPLQQKTISEFDLAASQVTRTVDPNGAVMQQIFDVFGRPSLKQVSNPQSPASFVTVQEIAYFDSAQPKYTEAKNYFDTGLFSVSREYFDAFDRSIQKKAQTATAGQWTTIDISYDIRGRVARTSLPYLTTINDYTSADLSKPATTYAYDSLDRVLTETTPVGTTTYAYNGWTVTITDAQNHSKDITRDAYGNIKTVVEHKGASLYTTAYEYNVSNKLTKITDVLNNVRNFSYNDLDRLTSQDMVHRSGTTGTTESYTSYDNNGNLLQKTTFKGDTIVYTYDDLNRVLTETVNGTLSLTYAYDQGTYGKGHLTSVAYAGGDSASYVNDVLGRKTLETHVIKGTSYTLAYEYNLSGALSKVTYPDSKFVIYQFNSIGQVSGVLINKTGSNEVLVSNLQYDPTGKLTHLERSNGVVTDYTYDPQQAYRLTRLRSVKGATVLQDIVYAYQPAGNIQTINDTAPTAIAKSATFGYDELDRLTSASVTYPNTPASNYSVTYGYDATGNMTSDSSGGSRTYGSTTQPHQLTAVGTTSIGYDTAGNTTTQGTKLFTWDGRNRMTTSKTSSASAQTTKYLYDHNNQRYLKYTEDVVRVKGKKVTQAIAEDRYVSNRYQIDMAGAKKDHVYLGSQKLATLNNGVDLFFTISDHLGSGSIITNSTGTVAELRDFKPYGVQSISQIPIPSGNSYKFTGKEVDPESTLQYFGARYMDNTLARFSSVDPALLSVADLQKVLNDPKSLNSYAYARNNPIVLLDPDGNRDGSFLQFLFTQPTLPQFNLFSQSPRQSIETAAGLTPYVSTVQDAYELGTGKELFTGEKLNPFQRTLAAVGLAAPFVSGGILRNVAKGGEELIELYHGSKNNYFNIMSEGFKKDYPKELFVTTNIDDALKSSQILSSDSVNAIKISLPRNLYKTWVDSKMLIDKTFSNLPGVKEFKVEKEIIEQLSKYIKR